MDEQIDELMDDPFDARLRAEVAYIDDDGFTARVLQQIPKPRQRRSFRAVILLGVTLISCLVAYLLSGRGRFISEGVANLSTMSLGSVLVLALATGLAVTGFSLAAAFWKLRESL